jgi:hypothetical protein
MATWRAPKRCKRTHEPTNQWPVPVEIVDLIFTFMDIKTLKACRLVDKLCNELIKNHLLHRKVLFKMNPFSIKQLLTMEYYWQLDITRTTFDKPFCVPLDRIWKINIVDRDTDRTHDLRSFKMNTLEFHAAAEEMSDVYTPMYDTERVLFDSLETIIMKHCVVEMHALNGVTKNIICDECIVYFVGYLDIQAEAIIFKNCVFYQGDDDTTGHSEGCYARLTYLCFFNCEMLRIRNYAYRMFHRALFVWVRDSTSVTNYFYNRRFEEPLQLLYLNMTHPGGLELMTIAFRTKVLVCNMKDSRSIKLAAPIDMVCMHFDKMFHITQQKIISFKHGTDAVKIRLSIDPMPSQQSLAETTIYNREYSGDYSTLEKGLHLGQCCVHFEVEFLQTDEKRKRLKEAYAINEKANQFVLKWARYFPPEIIQHVQKKQQP